jgi:hypothetical protein
MNTRHSRRHAGTLLVLGLALAYPASAQEEAPAETETSRLGHFWVDLETWVAQPTGLQYVPATELDLDNPLDTRTIELDHSTNSEARYQFEWEMPSEWGRLRGTIYKHTDNEDLQRLDPANFTFGETLTHSLFAGVNNDGAADGFSSASTTRTRDTRIDFARRAFSSPRVSADWFIGWRRVEHSRSLAAEYYALVPGFPPLLPPAGFCNPVPFCPLDPIPDTASMTSDHESRGATAGIEIDFPVWRNQVLLEGDLSIAVMRGSTTTTYTAQNAYYLLDEEAAQLGTGSVILGPPYDEFDDIILVQNAPVPLLNYISQESFPIGLQSDLSTDTQVLDAALGFRWRTPLKWLEVVGGMRQTYYQNVGADVRPKISTVTTTEDGIPVYNIEDVDQVERSATYEGFYGGVRVRLY